VGFIFHSESESYIPTIREMEREAEEKSYCGLCGNEAGAGRSRCDVCLDMPQDWPTGPTAETTLRRRGPSRHAKRKRARR